MNIEFRVWNNNLKYFYDPQKIKFSADFKLFGLYLPELGGYCFASFKDSEIIPQQYTGLKDKNGKKIFEGDIVRHWICLGPAGESQIVSEVKISPFGPNLEQWTYNDNLLPEIIGNVFEHPELLER